MSNAEKEALLRVFAGVVQPLMKVAFHYGITANEICGVAKRVFVETLEKNLTEKGRPTTDARLALVSGLSKLDVAIAREATRTGAPHGLRAAASLDQITNFLTTWHTHKSFSGAYGLALDLDLHVMPNSPRRTFGELVQAACPSVDPEALLDELVASGSVEVTAAKTVRCLSRAYVPKGEDVVRVERMGRFLSAVVANFVHNLLRDDDQPPFFERAVVSDFPMTERSRDRLLSVTVERGQELLTELDTLLTKLAEAEPTSQGRRYGVGIYFFEEQQPASSTGQQTAVVANPLGQDRLSREIDVLAQPAQSRKT